MNGFAYRMRAGGDRALQGRSIDILQVNVGLRCNLRCTHCHLSASPDRPESMDRFTMDRIVETANEIEPRMVDITGGSPELHPHLRSFIRGLRENGHAVQVRTNLTVLQEAGMESLPEFFREHRVRLVASLPCYLEQNVDVQRGRGAYAGSIEVLRGLNRLGYGTQEGPGLDLVYNPIGPTLPPVQAPLESDYKRLLKERFGIIFTRLLTITNMPIGRFRERLEREDNLREYLTLLEGAFNPDTLQGLMCRLQVSVGWDGTLYDCDFNLALGLPVNHGAPDHIRSFDTDRLVNRRIVTGEHCFGCTAGCGSSCGGSLVSATLP